ncbi:MAG: hypothetical protein JST00_25835 [Deltaproteobacteria bacterium]|nr:hypothetical protein [Deltaproteobacteria bacterium]
MSADPAPPRELVVDPQPAPGDASAGSGAGMAHVVVPVLAAGFLAQYVSLRAAILALGGGIALHVLRRRPDLGRFVLRVEGRELLVSRERSKGEVVRVALEDVLDVTLDKEMQPTGGRGGASAERVHIALHRPEPAPRILVPEARITPIEGQEWQAKVRVFLRKHGWLPADER